MNHCPLTRGEAMSPQVQRTGGYSLITSEGHNHLPMWAPGEVTRAAGQLGGGALGRGL